jgi:hypothetical protein
MLPGLVLTPPTSGGLTTDGSASTSGNVMGVCAGVAGCVIKARADINGDGRRDAVGIASRGKDGERAMIVRVKTSATHIDTVWRPTPYWIGPQWQGTAQLDGKSGREIVVARTMGAHAQLYRSLTWRRGGLSAFDAPGPGGSWMIDSAIWTSVGWKGGANTPAGTIKHRIAVRTGDTRSHFEGTLLTYSWSRNGWDRVSSRTIPSISDRRAYRWGGFHVPGLARW